MAEIGTKRVKTLVKEWFAKSTIHEWKRLKQDPYHQIEFIITRSFLETYLPKKGLILDAGGGPGRYTIELAKWGYNIVLLDLVPEMLTLAKRKVQQAGVLRKVKGVKEGSIEDLSEFSDENFDAVLCLGGSLNHLLGEKQREKAVSELIRVARNRATIFVSVISRIGLLRSILVEFPHEMKYVKHHWEDGNYIPGLYGEGFTAAHWFMPSELRALFENHGVKTLKMAGLEGLSSHHKEETNKLFKDKEKWRIWVEVLKATCTQPSVIGSSEHFLTVFRKP